MVKHENDNLMTDSRGGLRICKNYFERLFYIEFKSDQEKKILKFHTVELMIKDSTISKVKSAIKRLKIHKAPGIDFILLELIN